MFLFFYIFPGRNLTFAAISPYNLQFEYNFFIQVHVQLRNMDMHLGDMLQVSRRQLQLQ